MKKEVSMFLLFTLVCVSILVTSAHAEDESQQTRIAVNKTLNWTLRCEAVNHEIDRRITHYENKDMQSTRFVKLNESLQMLITKAQSKGLNTSLLEADLLVLNEKIATFQDDYALFIQKLKDTKNYTCGHSEGQFKAALNESKVQLRIVHQDAKDIKEFVGTTIKEDISFLREGAKAQQDERRIQHLEEQKRKIEDRMEKFRNESLRHKAELEMRQHKLDNRSLMVREQIDQMQRRKKAMMNETRPDLKENNTQ